MFEVQIASNSQEYFVIDEAIEFRFDLIEMNFGTVCLLHTFMAKWLMFSIIVIVIAALRVKSVESREDGAFHKLLFVSIGMIYE